MLHNCASNNNNRLVIGLDRHCDSIFSSFLHGLFLSKRRLARSRVPRHVYEEEKRERKERKWKRIDGKIRTARRASRPGRRPSLVQSFLQLCACGILGAGLWLRLAYSGYTTLVPHYSFASADSLLLAAGCVTFVIAFFGCCGAWFQSRCMLITVRIYIYISLLRIQTFNLLLFPYSISVW